jgi:hypothetical protein
VLLPDRWWLWAIYLTLVLLVVEAMARGRLVDLLLNGAVTLAGLTAVVLVWEFWRGLLVAALVGLALLIMRDNLRELGGR